MVGEGLSQFTSACNFFSHILLKNRPFKAPLTFWLDFLTEYNKLMTSLLLSFFHRIGFLVRWIFLFNIIVLIGRGHFQPEVLAMASQRSPSFTMHLLILDASVPSVYSFLVSPGCKDVSYGSVIMR